MEKKSHLTSLIIMFTGVVIFFGAYIYYNLDSFLPAETAPEAVITDNQAETKNPAGFLVYQAAISLFGDEVSAVDGDINEIMPPVRGVYSRPIQGGAGTKKVSSAAFSVGGENARYDVVATAQGNELRYVTKNNSQVLATIAGNVTDLKVSLVSNLVGYVADGTLTIQKEGRVISTFDNVVAFDWLDEKRIVMARTDGLYVIETATSESRLVFPISVSPSASLAVASDGQTVMVTNPELGQLDVYIVRQSESDIAVIDPSYSVSDFEGTPNRVVCGDGYSYCAVGDVTGDSVFVRYYSLNEREAFAVVEISDAMPQSFVLYDWARMDPSLSQRTVVY